MSHLDLAFFESGAVRDRVLRFFRPRDHGLTVTLLVPFSFFLSCPIDSGILALGLALSDPHLTIAHRFARLVGNGSLLLFTLLLSTLELPPALPTNQPCFSSETGAP